MTNIISKKKFQSEFVPELEVMFKYTANTDIVQKFDQISKNSINLSDEYYLALSITGTARAYFSCGDFWTNYLACNFYSKTMRKEIPINGTLISVKWFTETKI